MTTATATSAQNLYDAARPWMTVLRGSVEFTQRLQRPEKGDLDNGKVVVLVMFKTERMLDKRAFEELELLALLAGVDHAALALALSHAWPQHELDSIKAFGKRPFPFECDLTFNVTYGVNVRQLSLFGVDITTERARLFCPGLQRLMGTSTGTVDAGARICAPLGRVNGVEIPASLTWTSVTAIFSALQASQSIEQVVINLQTPRVRHQNINHVAMDRQDQVHLWQWIARAVFSRQETHRLKRVYILVHDLRADHAVAMRDVLCGPDFYVKRGHSLRGLKYVVASRFHFVSPDKGSHNTRSGGANVVHVRQQKVPVIHSQNSNDRSSSDEDWTTVLLPGWGHAWVHRDDAVAGETTDTAAEHSSTGRSLLDVRLLWLTDQSMDAVLALLQLVGRGITYLRFRNVTCERPLDFFLCSVFEACPQLEELAIEDGGWMQSLDTFAHCYERGLCRHLRRLELHELSLIDTSHSLKFFTKLADVTHLIAHHLSSLSFGNRQPGAFPRMAVARIPVLRGNKVLHSISCTVMCRVDDEEKAKTKVLRSFNKTPMVVQLEMRSKLAFLSALQGGRSVQAMRQLDSCVLSIVLQFAANCHIRSVRVSHNPSPRVNA